MPRGPIGPAALTEKASLRMTRGERETLDRIRGGLSDSECIRRLIVQEGRRQLAPAETPEERP